jgi:hypothetical protein
VNPLFGLDGGNVLNSTLAYQGDYTLFGTPLDPMIGQRVGGTITFGGIGLHGLRRSFRCVAHPQELGSAAAEPSGSADIRDRSGEHERSSALSERYG